MKIGIVALNFAPGTIGGAESYYVDLIKYLQEVDKKNQYIVFMRDSYSDFLPIKNTNFSIKSVTSSKLSLFVAKVSKKLFHIDLQQSRINSEHCDILHFPFQIVPFAGLNTKVISTAIDIQEEYYPEFFSAQDLASRKQLHALSVERSERLIAISDFTRDTYLKKYDISKSKVKTVHLSYNEELYTAKRLTPSLELPENYFYYPAATWPHKNHELLLRAFELFVRSNPEYSLVLSGIKKQGSDELAVLINDLGISENVVFLGYVDRKSLPELHQRATAMVFPSLFEGFGIPVLEAMACGCPVICSNTSSLPEVGGSAAQYFDPTNPQAIADAMTQVVGDPKLRAKMVKAGLAQAAKFSARKTAQQTLAVYQQVGANNE